MLSRVVLSVVVGVIVTLVCLLVGGILISLTVALAVTVGQFLKDYAAVLGVLAALAWFFSGRTNLRV